MARQQSSRYDNVGAFRTRQGTMLSANDQGVTAQTPASRAQHPLDSPSAVQCARTKKKAAQAPLFR